MHYDVIIIGGGAAGMMAAAAAFGSVCLIEKNDCLGKKVAMTGGGRCNVTNATDVDGILSKTVSNPHFLYSALYGFTPDDMRAFLNDNGVQTKIEVGGRVFPVSDKSSDIIAAFGRNLKDKDVKVRCNTEVLGLACFDEYFEVKTNKDTLKCRHLIIATGGLSYPGTGSTGDGLAFAKSLGHKIIPPCPALTPLICSDAWVHELMGLSLANVHLTAKVNGRTLFDDVGDVIFTHFGISGPLALSASAYLAGYTASELTIDFTPNSTKQDLEAQLLEYFKSNPNRSVKSALEQYLPKKLTSTILVLTNISQDKKINAVTKDERANLLAQIKTTTISIIGNRGFKEAVITAGGVSTKEIDSSTMQSKKIPRLYFAGEMIDIHALTGGYNLQISFSTGHLAGSSAKD